MENIEDDCYSLKYKMTQLQLVKQLKASKAINNYTILTWDKPMLYPTLNVMALKSIIFTGMRWLS